MKDIELIGCGFVTHFLADILQLGFIMVMMSIIAVCNNDFPLVHVLSCNIHTWAEPFRLQRF